MAVVRMSGGWESGSWPPVERPIDAERYRVSPLRSDDEIIADVLANPFVPPYNMTVRAHVLPPLDRSDHVMDTIRWILREMRLRGPFGSIKTTGG